MKLNTGMNLSADLDKLEFIYGEDTTGPLTEKRSCLLYTSKWITCLIKLNISRLIEKI